MAPPVPIPNTEVKRCSPDGSATIGCARVGRRQNKSPALGNRPRGFCLLGDEVLETRAPGDRGPVETPSQNASSDKVVAPTKRWRFSASAARSPRLRRLRNSIRRGHACVSLPANAHVRRGDVRDDVALQVYFGTSRVTDDAQIDAQTFDSVADCRVDVVS